MFCFIIIGKRGDKGRDILKYWHTFTLAVYLYISYAWRVWRYQTSNQNP